MINENLDELTKLSNDIETSSSEFMKLLKNRLDIIPPTSNINSAKEVSDNDDNMIYSAIDWDKLANLIRIHDPDLVSVGCYNDLYMTKEIVYSKKYGPVFDNHAVTSSFNDEIVALFQYGPTNVEKTEDGFIDYDRGENFRIELYDTCNKSCTSDKIEDEWPPSAQLRLLIEDPNSDSIGDYLLKMAMCSKLVIEAIKSGKL